MNLSPCIILSLIFATTALVDPKESQPKPNPDWVRYIDQGEREARLKGYSTPEGIHLEIVAEFPTVVNPLALSFSPSGVLTVIEWAAPPADKMRQETVTFTAKDGSQRKVTVMKKGVKDRIKVLTDSTGKGIYDRATILLEEEWPTSVLESGGWLYVASQGSVRRYKRSKADGPFDVKETIVFGFGGMDQYQLTGLTISPDGWLYIVGGSDRGPVEGSDGSQVLAPPTAAVFRCRPDGSKLHLFALGLPGPVHGVAVNAGGNLFQMVDESSVTTKPTRCWLLHLAEGCDFGWRRPTGGQSCVPEPVRSAFAPLPGKIAPMYNLGPGRPQGLLIYNDTRFPEPYRGLLLASDAAGQRVRALQIEPSGSTFEVTHEFDVLKSTDRLFRPSQMAVGPDGAIYVADWRADPLKNQPWGDGKNGRIYRLTWSGTAAYPALEPRGKDSWAKITAQSDEELVKTLANEDFSERQRAQEELRRRGEKNRPALLQLLANDEKPVRARIAALGVLASFWNDEVAAAVRELYKEGNGDLRRLAAEVTGWNCQRGDRDSHEALVARLNDPEASVRRAMLLAIGRIGVPGAEDVLISALQFDDGKDEVLRDGIVRAIEMTGERGIQKLLALGDSGEARDWTLAAETFQALRMPAAGKALPRMLRNVHLKPQQQADLIRSFANYQPPISLEPVLDFLREQLIGTTRIEDKKKRAARSLELTPVKLAALDVLSVGGGLKGQKGEALLLELLRQESELPVRLAVIQAVADLRLPPAVPLLKERLDHPRLEDAERQALRRALQQIAP